MRIERVISGGQTGADQAGWRAAKAEGIATGGHPTIEANVRAADMILVFDAWPPPCYSEFRREVVRLTQVDLGNGGARSEPPRELIDMGGIHLPDARPGYRVRYPYYELRHGHGYCVRYPLEKWFEPARLAERVKKVMPKVLMVIGSTEETDPGIGAWVEAYLTEVFRLLDGAPP